MNTDARTPHCPNCSQPMKLARVTPRFGGLPELQTFECRPCRETITKTVEAFGAAVGRCPAQA